MDAADPFEVCIVAQASHFSGRSRPTHLSDLHRPWPTFAAVSFVRG
jgi:hypothetical protein